MAHLREINIHRCNRCGKRAAVQGHNERNAPMGYFCRPCGRRWLKEQEKRQQ